MRRMSIVLVLGAAVASAGTPKQKLGKAEVDAEAILDYLVQYKDLVGNPAIDGGGPGDKPLAPEQFRFNINNSWDSADGYSRDTYTGDNNLTRGSVEPSKQAWAVAADGKAGWAAADYVERDQCYDGPPGMKCPILRRVHATMLFEIHGDGSVAPIISHVAPVFDAAAQKRANIDVGELDEVRAPAATDVVTLFRASLATPVAFAKTVSARRDVLLYGSGPGERYVGGAAVRAQLVKWGLALSVHDKVRAGVLSSGTVAWVAANVDAAKHPGTSYRLTCVYELDHGAWKIVQAQFSLPAE